VKTCFKCGVEKPRAEFYRHPEMGDGLLGKCKDCTRRDVSAHRAGNVERVTRYDRARSAAKRKVRALGGVLLMQVRRTEAEKVQRRRASQAVTSAMRSGRLVRPEGCEDCGTSPARSARGLSLIQAHHDDYTQPLAVRWLCPPCHVVADVAAGTRLRRAA
jgi:hypothetical protein